MKYYLITEDELVKANLEVKARPIPEEANLVIATKKKWMEGPPMEGHWADLIVFEWDLIADRQFETTVSGIKFTQNKED